MFSAKSLSFISFCPIELFYYSTSLLLPLNFFCCWCPLYLWAFLVAQMINNQPAMRETWVQSLGWEDPLEKVMATHSSILACRTCHGQSSLVGYSPKRLQRVRHDRALSTWHTASICTLSLLPLFSYFAGKVSFPMASNSVDMMTTPRFIVDFWPLQSVPKVYFIYPVLDVFLA